MKTLPTRHEKITPRWHLTIGALIPAILMLLGLVILLYPRATMWLSQYNMSQINSQYHSRIEKVKPEAHEQIRLAHEYNDSLESGASYEAHTNIPTSHGEPSDSSLNYWDMLKADANGLMARLQIKKIDLDLPVYHGTSEETLLKGLGHLRGTSLPVGGVGTRTVITGHRGLATAEMFTRLNEVKVGDTFVITVFNEVLTYKVRDIKVVDPDEKQAILPEKGKDLATLVTCTPLGINSHRILVTGERVFPTPKSDEDAANRPPEVPRFPWWIVYFLVGVALIGAYLRWAGMPVKKKKKEKDPIAASQDKEAKKGKRKTRKKKAEKNKTGKKIV